MSDSDDACPEENTRQSEHSPSVVADGERLARYIYLNEQVNLDTRELKTGAFALDDLIEPDRKGLSFDRLEHVTREEVERRGAEFAARKLQGEFHGLAVNTASAVRSITDDNNVRMLGVIDDGMINNIAHSLAVQSKKLRDRALGHRQLRVALKPVRERLMDLFSPVRAVEEIYESDG